MTIQTSMASDEALIRNLLDTRAAAIRSKDVPPLYPPGVRRW
jgi:hypothetical protein